MIPSYEFLAATVHIGWSAYLALLLCLLSCPKLALALFVPLLALKEFVCDPMIEHDTFLDGVIDSAWCMLGFGLGYGSHKLHLWSRGVYNSASDL